MKLSILMSLAAVTFGFGQTWDRWPEPKGLSGPHPGYDLALARPDSFTPSVSGMDFLPDGKLLLVTLIEGPVSKGSAKGIIVGRGKGKVYLLEGVGGADRSRIQVKEFGAEFMNPLGLKVVQGRIFVVHQHGITELTDADGDGRAESQKLLAAFPEAAVEGECCTWAHGLVHKDGFLYTVSSRSFPNGGRVMQINLKDGSRKFFAEGLRHPNGLGLGPDGEIFIADQQGEWRPSSPLYRLRENAHYGHPLTSASVRPNLYMPHGEAANSPSEPLLADQGAFKGQLILGDSRFGSIHRLSLEKVGGEYQGALFHFSGGVEAGVNRLAWGPDGALYMGALGAEGHFSWRLRETFFGLQRLKANGKPVFEMLNIKSRAEGFLLEFTLPVDPFLAKAAGRFSVDSWEYAPTAQYGGPMLKPETNAVRDVQVSPDGRKVYLKVDGLRPGRVVHVTHQAELLSQSGLRPWIREAWYTLNTLGQAFAASDFQGSTGVEADFGNGASLLASTRGGSGKTLRFQGKGSHRIWLRDARGALLAHWRGHGAAEYDLSPWQGRLVLWTVRTGQGTLAGKAVP